MTEERGTLWWISTGLIVVGACLMVFSYAVDGASPDDTIGQVPDSSGNGFTLQPAEFGFADGIGFRNSPAPKFGKGYDFPNDDGLRGNYSGLRVAGNLSLFAAIERDTLSSDFVVFLGLRDSPETENFNVLFQFACQANASVLVAHEFGAGSPVQGFSPPVNCGQGFHTVSVVRDNSLRRYYVRIDGVPRFNFTYTAGQIPTGGTDSPFVLGYQELVGGTSAGNAWDGGMYEIRFWDKVVSNATLISLANLTDTTYQQTAVGDELGLWFFEWEGNKCLLCARPSPSVLRTFLERGGVALLFVAIGSLVAMKLGVIPLGRTKN